MGKFDTTDSKPQIEGSTKVPEGINQRIFYAINYFKENIDGILSLFDPQTARNYQTVIDALSSLDEKLDIRFNSDSPLFQIADFASTCSNEKIHIGNVLTHSVVEAKKSHAALSLYWLESLRTLWINKASLSSNGGTYEVGVRFDKDSNTIGGEELQQALAALLLHRADIVSHTGLKPLDPDFEENFDPKSRVPIVTSARELLKSPFWKNIAHLQHIIKPTSKPWFYSHDSSLRIFRGKPVRRERALDQEIIRLFRSSEDHQSGWYIDLPVKDVLTLPAQELGQLLLASDTTESHVLEKRHSWKKLTDSLELWNKEEEPPAFSLSSGIYEHGNKLLQEVAANGNSITHLAYDFGKIKLQVSHVAENGASLKVGALDVAHALQSGRKQGESLATTNSPFTEIRPPYRKTALPPSNWLITRAVNNEQALRNLLEAFGLSDVRIGFDDLTPEDTQGITNLAQELNARFVTPKRERLRKYILEHSSPSSPMTEDDIEQFLKIFAPELTVQDVFILGNKIFEGNTASNQLPLKPDIELIHPSVADLRTGQDSIYHQEWIDLYQTEKVLGKFGLNIYNSYKLLTMAWRKTPVIGAEALGKIFAHALAEYTNVLRHISDLAGFRAIVKGEEVELDDFHTARPDPNEENANAMATFTQEENGAFRIRVRFRDNLTPTLFKKFKIDNSTYFRDHLKLVATDILNTQEDNVSRLIRSQAELLLTRWNQISMDIDSQKPEEIFPRLVLENSQALRDSNNTFLFSAFQLLLTAGIRRFESRKIQTILQLK